MEYKNKKYFEQSDSNYSVKSFLSSLKFDYNNLFRFKQIPDFIEVHKDDLIFLFKSYEKSNIHLKKIAYAEIILENIKKCNSYTIGKSGYGLDNDHNMDVLVTSNEMIKVSLILKKYGYNLKESDYIWFDYEDYNLFFKKESLGKKLKKYEYQGKYLLKGETFVSPTINYNDIKLENRLESYRNINVNRKNIYEQKISKILDELNIKYEYQKIVVIKDSSYIMDFYITNKNICIEIDGEYHQGKEQLLKDIYRNNIMAKKGILTIRYTNYEIDNDINIIKEELNHLINNI